MKYRVSHQTEYDYSGIVSVCHNLVHLAPRQLAYQQCDRFQLDIQPSPVDVGEREDYFGNWVSYFSIERPHRGLKVTADSVVRVNPRPSLQEAGADPWETVVEQLREVQSPITLSAFQYTGVSPSINPFRELRDYAAASFPSGQSILGGVLDLTARIHADVEYDARATTVQTPIQEVFHRRQGVCQDFAHLQIGCLRALGIAARYVSGYLRTIPPPGQARLIGADASHAWLSVYCGQAGWIDIDPTNNTIVGTDHITVAWGRDYADVCPIQGVIVGGGQHLMRVAVNVEPMESDDFPR